MKQDVWFGPWLQFSQLTGRCKRALNSGALWSSRLANYRTDSKRAARSTQLVFKSLVSDFFVDVRKGVRVIEWGGLESRWASDRTQGLNPIASYQLLRLVDDFRGQRSAVLINHPQTAESRSSKLPTVHLLRGYQNDAMLNVHFGHKSGH